MSKEAYETWVTEVGTKRGKRYATRRLLHLPFLAAVGEYEALSDLQLREIIHDLMHEYARRELRDECPDIGPITDADLPDTAPVRWTPDLAYARTAT